MMTYEERYESYRARIAAGMSLDDMSAEISLLADKIQNVINVAMQKEQFETQLKAYHQALALQEWKEEIAKEEEDSNHTNQVIFSVAKVAVLGAVAFFAPPLLPTVAPFVGAVGSASNMIATGLICGATDAAVQGVAVDLGLQSRFSVNELLETAFSSGVGSGTGGLNAIEQTAAVTATATGTQFTEIALGLKDKFEPQAVALQAASAAIARGLHEVLPSLNQTLGESNGSLIAKTAVHSAINSVLSHVVTGTPISFEQMATEISGKLIACKVGEALASNSSPKTKNTEVEKIDIAKVSTPKLNPLHAQGLFGKSQIESTVNKAILSGDWEKTKASMLECSKDNVDAVAALNIPSLDLSRIRGGDIRCANLPEVKPAPTNSPNNAIAKTSNDMAQALDDAIKRAKMNPNIPHEAPLEPVYPELWLWGATDAAKLGVGLWKIAGSGASKAARAIGGVGSKGGERYLGLTTRLNRTQIKEYLSNIHNIPREELIKDLESVGFQFKGGSKDGRFLTFTDKYSNKRIEIHPPDKVGTDYYHIHIFDKRGNSLNSNLQKVPRNSPEAHIQIKDDYGYRPDLTN